MSTTEFTAETEYDSIQIVVDDTHTHPSNIYFYLGETCTARLSRPLNENNMVLLGLVKNKVESGNVEVAWFFQEGDTFESGRVPEFFRPYIAFSDPFEWLDYFATEVTSRRQQKVKDWALRSTDPRIVMASLSSGKRAILPDPTLSKKRDIGGIWCNFVAATVAAAQDDIWVENATVWAGIERNMEIDPFDFFDDAPPDVWNEIAGHLESFTRFYKAPASQLTSKPVHVQVGTLDEDKVVMQAGAAKARNIVYKGSAYNI